MAYVKWHGIYAIKNKKIIDQMEFEKNPETIANQLLFLRNKNYPEFIYKYKEYNETIEFEEDQELLHEALLKFGEMRVKEETLKEEGIIQAVNTLKDLDIYVNYLEEHLTDWIKTYYLSIDPSKIKELLENPPNFLETSKVYHDKYDIMALEKFTKFLKDAAQLRLELENYIIAKMELLAPNLAAVAGPIIGARLIAESGSLRELANMPSSTVQVLGATTAMFRHLKTGAKPPKHGILFKHPLVHSAPLSKRGKMARVLSGKVVIAARTDCYSDKNHGEELKKQLNKSVQKLL